MRTYGRISTGNTYVWKEVDTSPDGDDSEVWLTTLCQTLKLNLGESPFWANYGIPAQQSVTTQVYPDYYMAITQAQFTPYFTSLSVAKRTGTANPTYDIQAVTPSGALFTGQIAQ